MTVQSQNRNEGLTQREHLESVRVEKEKKVNESVLL